MVNLELYRIFKIVADEENITKASKRLNISQPAVTKHIKNLEEIFNFKLFERTNTGLSLTENGKKIYNEIKDSVIILDNTYTKYSNNRYVNLGIHAAMLDSNFSNKILTCFDKENSNINIMNYNTDEMLVMLEKQELDIAISKKNPDYNNEKIEFIKLGELHDILVVDEKNNLIKEVVTINELKNIELYLPRHNSVTEKNFFKSIKSKESEFKKIRNISYVSMLKSIKANNTVGLITKEYIVDELKNGTILELKTDIQIAPIEYGIYINKENKFDLLNEIIEDLK